MNTGPHWHQAQASKAAKDLVKDEAVWHGERDKVAAGADPGPENGPGSHSQAYDQAKITEELRVRNSGFNAGLSPSLPPSLSPCVRAHACVCQCE